MKKIKAAALESIAESNAVPVFWLDESYFGSKFSSI